jgi:hypothetical protein
VNGRRAECRPNGVATARSANLVRRVAREDGTPRIAHIVDSDYPVFERLNRYRFMSTSFIVAFNKTNRGPKRKRPPSEAA